MHKEFVPGEGYIPSSGKVFDDQEINNAIAAAYDGVWTEGRFAKQFEKEFSNYLGLRCTALANSGSSANLLAVASLTAGKFKERALKQGDEYITCALAFPTTVNPGILYGLTPVFVDCDPRTLAIDVNYLEQAISEKTKLIMIAHTLGIPSAIEEILRVVKKYNLWFIEDCCDALGSLYDDKLVGTFGDIATFSFYPAHHITMGEGGAISTNNPLINKMVKRFRDWGRDCWCDPGKDNTCGKRFDWQLGDLPLGYDHKYIYSEIGYNLKLTDFQAAIGVAQLKKLPLFVEKRKKNYQKYYEFFSQFIKYFNLIEIPYKADPCWFGFPIIVRQGAPFTRNQLTEYLEHNKIGTRNVFSGNILRHPAYKNINYRIIGEMKSADMIMSQAFWIGVYPGINDEMIEYVKKTVETFLKKY